MARVPVNAMVTGPAPGPAPRAGRWSDFGLRLASAAVLAPVALLALWFGGLAWAAAVALALAGLGTEWAALTGAKNGALILPAALLAALGAGFFIGWWLGFAVLAAAALLVGWRFGWLVAAGIPYAGVGGLALLWLRIAPGAGLRDAVFLIAVIWATDTGAYLAGRVVGGAKLAPRISPGKTWSGACGGLAAAAIAGWLLAGLDLRALPVALALSLLAQAGDLLESAIKRKLGVKDSGRTIPGHGGLFDRLDGFLAAAPLAALLALGAEGGLPLWR